MPDIAIGTLISNMIPIAIVLQIAWIAFPHRLGNLGPSHWTGRRHAAAPGIL